MHNNKPSNPLDLTNVLSLRNQSPLIVAHRGEWAEMPENSLAAFEAARTAGAHIAEIDAQATSDGTLVVFHDTDLHRMTGVSGAVGEQTIETIRRLRLKAGRGGETARATEHCIPTLEEALEATRGRIFVNIDTKFARDLDRIAETVLEMEMCDQVLVKIGVEFDGDHSAILDAPWFGKVPFMPIIPARPGRFADDAMRIIDAFRPQMIEIMFERLEDLAAARPVLEKNDVRLWTNTLNEVHSLSFSDDNALRDPAAVWGVLIAEGIGAVQTDVSAALARFLAGRNLWKG